MTRIALARANEKRDWRLRSGLAYRLMHRSRLHYRDELVVLDLEIPVCTVDLTLSHLSLAPCPWINWTGSDAAVKSHTALDLCGGFRRSSR